MATCDLSTLQTDACTNRFSCVPVGMAELLELQLLYDAASSDDTIGELLSEACTNRFACVPVGLGELVELQLLCNAIAAEEG